MNAVSASGTSYSVTRLTVDVAAPFEEFRAKYEDAVPPLPIQRVEELVKRGAPWPEMLRLIEDAAPLGFLIYWRNDVRPVMRLAGDTAPGVLYLMGNHTIAERMYHYRPAVMLYAPLHTMIWDGPDGTTKFTFDRPSDQFGSFGVPEIAQVGMELDDKLAALLDHLGLTVPRRAAGAPRT